MDKLVLQKDRVNDKILSGIDFIAKPVVSTLSPRGSNVLIELPDGNTAFTNDGATIAKNLSSSDQIEQAIIEIIKEASLRTNAEAGDGTTTTILLSSILAKEALKLIADGYSWIDIRNELNKFGEKLIAEIEKMKITVKDDVGLKEIATTSANNDPEIAKYVMDAVSVAREDGMIFLEANNKPGVTEVVKDLGFMVRSGILYQELLTTTGSNQVVFKDTPVLITDKKLYYSEEAESILRTAVKAGHKSIVIVAKDFLGEALNTLIANHTGKVINVMLIKDPKLTDSDNTSLYDLATYMSAKVFTDKTGSLVSKLTEKDFIIATQVFSDPQKTLFTPKVSGSKELKERVKMLKDELAKDTENKDLKSRLASLTTGIVTIKVGGHTPMEIREKVYRYEDAVNATRSAMKYGYLTGGGTSLLGAHRALQGHPTEYTTIYKKYCEAIVRQIAANCGKHEDTVVDKIKEGTGDFGYNALTDKYENLRKAGVVDPFQVMKLAILNSISVTTTIVSIKNYVINDYENDKEDDA